MKGLITSSGDVEYARISSAKALYLTDSICTATNNSTNIDNACIEIVATSWCDDIDFTQCKLKIDTTIKKQPPYKVKHLSKTPKFPKPPIINKKKINRNIYQRNR